MVPSLRPRNAAGDRAGGVVCPEHQATGKVRAGPPAASYVYELVLALQHLGWRWLETYIWTKPNAVPGRFGPRTKDAFEYVYHFAKGRKPYFDLDAVCVPYKAPPSEIHASAAGSLVAQHRRSRDRF